jgi:hypothetical protein
MKKKEKKIYSLRFIAGVWIEHDLVATSKEEALEKLKTKIDSYRNEFNSGDTGYVEFCNEKIVDYAECDLEHDITITVNDDPNLCLDDYEEVA